MDSLVDCITTDNVEGLRVAVKKYLEEGRHLNRTVWHDNTYFLRVAKSAEVVDILIPIIDDLERIGGPWNVTPLYHAFMKDRPEVFRALLYHGANMGATYKDETVVDRILRKQRRIPDYRAEILDICIEFEEQGEEVKDPGCE